jgi:hypothetical protein
MKKIIILLLFVCIYVLGMAQQNKQLKDGLYPADKALNDTSAYILKAHEVFVPFNRDFIENAPDSSAYIVVNTSDFVPLELSEEPVLLAQTESKKKLQLMFSPLASEKLEQFTRDNMMKQVTLVVDGEALTVNKVRAVIKNGKLEITRCSDNACQRIYVTLKNHNVEKKN